jgi:hypothetical protein
MKPIKLNANEIARATEAGYTIVVRPQAKTGLRMVAWVKVSTGEHAQKPVYVEPGAVSAAVAEMVRWADKACIGGGQMAHRSRGRAASKRALRRRGN